MTLTHTASQLASQLRAAATDVAAEAPELAAEAAADVRTRQASTVPTRRGTLARSVVTRATPDGVEVAATARHAWPVHSGVRRGPRHRAARPWLRRAAEAAAATLPAAATDWLDTILRRHQL